MSQERLDSNFYDAQPEQQSMMLDTAPTPSPVSGASVRLCAACGGSNHVGTTVCAPCTSMGVSAPSLF